MNGLDICAGGGIGSAVWRTLGGRTVCYVERDPYCQQLLQARMRDGVICDAPIWDDLRTFDGRPWRGRVDFLFGGIPCQPYSVAGKRQGEADERDLWPDTRRIIREVGPRLVLIENVPGLLARGLGRILGELAESGYDAEWDCLAASDIGADHERKRVWLVAYTKGERWNKLGWWQQTKTAREMEPARCDNATYWTITPTPEVCGMANGLAAELEQLRVVGNGWVPQVAAVVMARCAELLERGDNE